MAIAKTKPMHRTKPRNRETITMHDRDFGRVDRAVERARVGMKPGQIYANLRCPICGGYTAYVLRKEENNGRTCVGSCSNGCFELWE